MVELTPKKFLTRQGKNDSPRSFRFTSGCPIVETSPVPSEESKSCQKSITNLSSGKRRLMNRHSVLPINKLRWTAFDDLLLIEAIQMTNDLMSVYLGTSFSCKFTFKDIEERWEALLYNPQLNNEAMQELNQLTQIEKSLAESKVLWSPSEENLLSQLSSDSDPDINTFSQLLLSSPSVFHSSRTSESLKNHWQLLRKYYILCNQQVPFVQSIPITFSQALLGLKDKDLTQTSNRREFAFMYEKQLQAKKQKLEIAKLDGYLTEWRDILSGTLNSHFSHDTFAIIKGEKSEYKMKSSEIVLGRSTDVEMVDFDLSLEGPSSKVSRKHVQIVFTELTDSFSITNIGMRPIIVNDKLLDKNESCQLENASYIFIVGLSFIFLINNSRQHVRVFS